MSDANQDTPIGQLLLDEGLIDQAQLNEALALQEAEGGKTFEILVRLGHLDKDHLHDFLSRQPGVATIDLANYSIERDLVELVPKELALRESVLPIDKLGKLLTIAMACPLDKATIAEVEQLTGLRVKGVLCRLDHIAAAVSREYRDQGGNGPVEADFSHLAGALTGGSATAARDLGADVATLDALPVRAAARERLDTLGAESEPRAILDTVARDPGLTAGVLLRARAQVFGLPSESTALAVAVAAMGLTPIQALAREWGEGVVLPEAAQTVAAALGDQAYMVARAAARLARKVSGVEPAFIFTAAIWQATGALALCTLEPRRYVEACGERAGMARVVAECEAFGIGGPAAAAGLVRAWALPERLAVVCEGLTPEAPENLSLDAALLRVCVRHVAGEHLAEEQAALATLKLDAASAQQAMTGGAKV